MYLQQIILFIGAAWGAINGVNDLQRHHGVPKKATSAPALLVILVSFAGLLVLPCCEAWGRDADPVCDQEENCEADATPTPPSCGPCGAASPMMEAVMRHISAAKALPSFQAYVAATTNASFAQASPIDICGALSKFCWEDEKELIEKPEESKAFNCRDYARWFRECLIKHNYPPENVISQGFFCKNCDSRQEYGHVISIYQSEGLWCPHDAQASPEKNHEFYSECCNQDLESAISCAHSKYCAYQGKKDACCEANDTVDLTEPICREHCRFIETIEGEEKLQCNIPMIGTGACFPEQTPYQPPPPTPCEQEIQNCLNKNPRSCAACKRENLEACGGGCDKKATNESCTACCKQRPPSDLTKCLETSECVKKPLEYPHWYVGG